MRLSKELMDILKPYPIKTSLLKRLIRHKNSYFKDSQEDI